MDFEKFCEEHCVERKGTGTLKWDSLQEVFGDADLLPLWVADMEIQSPESVREALKKRVEHGVFGYGKVEDSYFEAFFAWQKKHHGMDLAKENVRFATGVVGSLYAAVRAYTKENASVVICPPVYYPFYDAILNTGRKLVTCELDNHEGHYQLDMEKFEKAITDNQAEMFILCSPHNPVCRVWTEEELAAMMEICKKHGVLVVSDEIHQDFAYEENPFVSSSMVKGGKYRDNLILLNSGSKTFNLAGLIHSHVIIYNEKLMETYDAYIKSIGSPEVNLMGVTGMEAAYRGGEEWFADVKALIQHNYNYMKQEFARELPNIVVTPLEGTYLSWIDLRGYMSGEEVADFIQKKCRLACDVGEWFSFTGHGFVRINLATDTKNIKTAVERIITNIKS
ncbi:MAG: pyridoxal phosphate-dependent aminotransferase [Lachnospiraceae bacterium]|jgi:cystathionine beta-lyase|nr:pyridoxal phosphate-dependent aminotransferase [Lachnospiraceae bacterium]